MVIQIMQIPDARWLNRIIYKGILQLVYIDHFQACLVAVCLRLELSGKATLSLIFSPVMAGPDSTATDIIKLLIPKADKSLSSPTRSLSASAKKLNVDPVPKNSRKYYIVDNNPFSLSI